MSTTNNLFGNCTCTVESYRFNHTSVRCVFKCKNPGYKTYNGLHKHYLDFHEICLHRVARLDRGNEDEFHRQVEFHLTPSTGGNTTSQGTRRNVVHPSFQSSDRAPFHAKKLQAVGPQPQSAGPSHLGEHRMLGNATIHSTSPNPEQGKFFDSPSVDPIGNLYHNRNSCLRPKILTEANPSCPPVAYPVTRHQPYPQSRPQQHTRPSPARGPSPRNYSKCVTPVIRPCNGLPLGSPMPPSAIPRLWESQQGAALIQRNHPATITPQGHMLLLGNLETGSSIQTHQTWHARSQHHHLESVITGPETCHPIPPMETNGVPSGPSCLPPLSQQEHLLQRVNQNRRLRLSNPLAAPVTPPRRVTQPLSHPYRRPAKIPSTSNLARKTCEVRKQGALTEMNTAREMFAVQMPSLAEGLVQATGDIPQEQNRTVGTTPGMAQAQEKENPISLTSPPTEPSPSRIHPTYKDSIPQPEYPTPVPHTPGCAQVQELFDSSVPCPLGPLQIAEEVLASPSMEPGPSRRPVQTQQQDLDKGHLEKAPSEENDATCMGRGTRDPFSEITWGGLVVIQTPDGVYLPETFDPSAFGDFTDAW